MASTSVKKLIAQGDRMKNKLKRIEVDTKRGEGVVLGVAGTAAAVFVDARMGEEREDFEVAGIPVTLAASAVLVAVGLSRKVPQAERVLELGKGPFYYSVGTFLRDKFEEEAGG